MLGVKNPKGKSGVKHVKACRCRRRASELDSEDESQEDLLYQRLGKLMAETCGIMDLSKDARAHCVNHFKFRVKLSGSLSSRARSLAFDM